MIVKNIGSVKRSCDILSCELRVTCAHPLSRVRRDLSPSPIEQVTHKEPEEAVDHVAYRGVRMLRYSFDLLAGFKVGVVDEHKCEQVMGIAVPPVVRADQRSSSHNHFP